jgi:hypothetical protein
MMSRHRTTRKPIAGNHKHSIDELRTHAEAVGRDMRDLASAAGDVARSQLDPLEEMVTRR